MVYAGVAWHEMVLRSVAAHIIWNVWNKFALCGASEAYGQAVARYWCKSAAKIGAYSCHNYTLMGILKLIANDVMAGLNVTKITRARVFCLREPFDVISDCF